MNKTSTIFMHAECSNIHLLLHVGTILVQYSGDDVIGKASIHVLLRIFMYQLSHSCALLGKMSRLDRKGDVTKGRRWIKACMGLGYG